MQKFVSRLRDYAELTKARVTTLIVLTAWCGYFLGAHKLGVSSWSLGLVHALLGVALVSSGTAALNEVLESKVDARMRRTALRPLPSGRMTKAHAAAVGLSLTLGGSAYLVCLNMNSAWGVIACCCLVSFAVDMGNPATWAFMQDIGGRATAAAFGWGNMWGNFGAAVIAKLVPKLLELGESGGTGQRNVFLVCSGALFLYGFISLCLDATKQVLKPTAPSAAAPPRQG